jgi:hypothetical protein
MSRLPREPRRRDGPDRLVAVGIVATVAIVLAAAVGQLVDYFAFDLRIRALDLATETSALDVVGGFGLLSAAAAAWVVLARDRRRTGAAVVLPPLLSFLAADDIFRLHDSVPHWQLLYLPVLFATFVALVVAATRLPHRSRHLIGASLVLLTLSYFLHRYGEDLVDAIGVSRAGVLYQFKVIAKHCAEVEGWLLVALALADPRATLESRIAQYDPRSGLRTQRGP